VRCQCIAGVADGGMLPIAQSYYKQWMRCGSFCMYNKCTKGEMT
jgi:hypothetical protein